MDDRKGILWGIATIGKNVTVKMEKKSNDNRRTTDRDQTETTGGIDDTTKKPLEVEKESGALVHDLEFMTPSASDSQQLLARRYEPDARTGSLPLSYPPAFCV